MHHVEIACVSYFNDEILAGNSLELMYSYKKGFWSILRGADVYSGAMLSVSPGKTARIYVMLGYAVLIGGCSG